MGFSRQEHWSGVPLLYIKQKTNKNLLHSTGNYIHCLTTTYHGKESEKNIQTNHFAIHLKVYNSVNLLYFSFENLFVYPMHGCQFLYQLCQKKGGVLILKTLLMVHFFLQMSVSSLDFPSVPFLTESLYFPIWKAHKKPSEVARSPQCELTTVVKKGLPLWLSW